MYENLIKKSMNYTQNKFTSNKKINHLGPYLAGLIEGDGSIIIRKGKQEKVTPAIIFTFHSNEIPLFEKIKIIIGSGNIYKEKQNICRYQITNIDAVIKVFNLVNGYFRTPKIEVLYKAIDNLNTWRNANIIKLPLDISDISSNSWLAGFTDADGHFSIKLIGNYGLSNSNERGRVKCVFSINQNEIYKKTGESCIPFMTILSKYFNCNLNYRNTISNLYKNPVKSVVFYVQNDKDHLLVTNYFNKYPLMSSKHLNYICYVKGLNYLGKRLTEKEILEIQAIKNSMNKKRIDYNWNHLKEFYR